MSRRYGVLGFIAGLYQAFGILLVAIAILYLVVAIINAANAPLYSRLTLAGALTIIAGAAGIAIGGAGAYAFGELINLFRDLELNTRRIAEQQSRNQSESFRL